ncbi:MAG: 30S ribosomal protein S11 [Candidatus Berkelbacteria bacterium Licking1014_2]|uniref:Small ribosomal subunit protein uS11 n=1 Tax=Candidatus Berkelbacteria bacterium Licking1014_2 TaxID=2017146 RepID=A0A554LWI3_9BACT|nr:MAG: 30S ribosomal protein S11 [Candidatus Berkelbacteria bacterium Licking1014_2]
MAKKKENQKKETIKNKEKVKIRFKKKTIPRVESGIFYIQSSFNNTIISLTDESGNILKQSSAGSSGFKGTKKSTPFAATTAMQNLLAKIGQIELKRGRILVSGVGAGRDAAIRALNNSGIEITAIRDITPVPHNGCRARKARRV